MELAKLDYNKELLQWRGAAKEEAGEEGIKIQEVYICSCSYKFVDGFNTTLAWVGG